MTGKKINNSIGDLKGIDLLHPEMLSVQQLCSLFEKWHVPSDFYENLDEEKLLELYYRTILPLPQRRYGKNRRGKLLSSLRKQSLESEVKIEEKAVNDTHTSTFNKKIKLSKTPSPSKSLNSSSKRSYSPISFEKETKKIISKSVNGLDYQKSSKKSEPEGPDGHKRSKIIKLINDTITSGRSDSSKYSPPHSSKYSSSHSSKSPEKYKEKSSRHRHREDKSPSSSPKKKHKPITWP